MAREWQSNKHLHKFSSVKAPEQFSSAAEKECFTQNKIIQNGQVQDTWLKEQAYDSPFLDFGGIPDS